MKSKLGLLKKDICDLKKEEEQLQQETCKV